MEAAAHEFASKGFGEVRVKEIAKRAKVSTGNLYVFYESKEDLLHEIIAESMQRIREICGQREKESLEVYEALLDIGDSEKDGIRCFAINPKLYEENIRCLVRRIKWDYESGYQNSSFLEANANVAAHAVIGILMEISNYPSVYRNREHEMAKLMCSTVDGIMSINQDDEPAVKSKAGKRAMIQQQDRY